MQNRIGSSDGERQSGCESDHQLQRGAEGGDDISEDAKRQHFDGVADVEREGTAA